MSRPAAFPTKETILKNVALWESLVTHIQTLITEIKHDQEMRKRQTMVHASIQSLFSEFVSPRFAYKKFDATKIERNVDGTRLFYDYDNVYISRTKREEFFEGSFDIFVHYMVSVDGQIIASEKYIPLNQ